MTISIAKPGPRWRKLGPVFSGLPVIAAGLCLLGALVLLPHAIESVNWLLIEDDPAALADRKLATVFDSNVAAREIEAALMAKDAELAKSFVDLARDRQVPVAPDLAERVEIAAKADDAPVDQDELDLLVRFHPQFGAAIFHAGSWN